MPMCAPGFYDPRNKAIGMAHAGWRGTRAHIGPVTLAAMEQAFGTRPRIVWWALALPSVLAAIPLGPRSGMSLRHWAQFSPGRGSSSWTCPGPINSFCSRKGFVPRTSNWPEYAPLAAKIYSSPTGDLAGSPAGWLRLWSSFEQRFLPL